MIVFVQVLRCSGQYHKWNTFSFDRDGRSPMTSLINRAVRPFCTAFSRFIVVVDVALWIRGPRSARSSSPPLIYLPSLPFGLASDISRVFVAVVQAEILPTRDQPRGGASIDTSIAAKRSDHQRDCELPRQLLKTDHPLTQATC